MIYEQSSFLTLPDVEHLTLLKNVWKKRKKAGIHVHFLPCQPILASFCLFVLTEVNLPVLSGQTDVVKGGVIQHTELRLDKPVQELHHNAMLSLLG